MASILVVSVDYFPKIGGISMMTHHLANAMVRNSNSVRALVPKDASAPAGLESLYETVVDTESNERVREGEGYEVECLRIGELLRTLHKEAPLDAILLMHPFYYGYAAMRFTQERNIRIGCFFHGFELKSQLLKSPALDERKGQKARAGRDLRFSTLRLLKECDRVFVNSSVTGELIHGQGRNLFRITGCGIDEPVIDAQLDTFEQKKLKESHARARLGLPENSMVLGYLGRIVPSKNIEFLIRILADQPEWHVAIAGAGDDEALKVLASELGVADRLVLLGPLDEAEKWLFYSALDLFCLPSIALPGGQMEGFGIVLLEATLKGVPIAVSSIGGMRDFVLDNNGIYIDVVDSDKSARWICEFLSNRSVQGRCVANAQRLLLEKLTYPKIAEDMVNDLLDESSRRS